ncbi:hypothetical protein BJ741DRAFT_697000 [Chytriomyces cf. hyalinus JEL632]|nr:hypothetical protein BJ741DRAFT_697000 [Chytriomyces cf. hyalinus JEL632]
MGTIQATECDFKACGTGGIWCAKMSDYCKTYSFRVSSSTENNIILGYVYQGETCKQPTTSTSTTTKTTSTSSSTTTSTSTSSSTTSTATSTTSTSTLTSTTFTGTTTTASTTTTTQTRVNAAPNAPKYSTAAPKKKLPKSHCEQVYAQVEVFSDSKYDALWDALEDPAHIFHDVTGQALAEEYEYHALKHYRANLKQCWINKKGDW